MTSTRAEAVKPFAGVSWRSAARCLALDSLAAETSSLLAAAGIECMLLKGPVTAARLYGARPDRRLYTDVDLLVAPDRFAAAETALRTSGYRDRWVGLREKEMPWHERPWQAPGSEFNVDLHRGLAGVDDAVALWSVMWSTRESVEVGGATIAAPDVVGSALIVGLHAARPGDSAKPLRDMQLANNVFGIDTWVAAAERSAVVGAGAAFRASLEQVPGGAEFARRLGLTTPVALHSRLIGRQPSSLSLGLASVLQATTVAELSANVVGRLLPSPALLRLRDPRACGGTRQLVLGYLRRWVGAVRGTSTAVREIRLARRETSMAPTGSSATCTDR